MTKVALFQRVDYRTILDPEKSVLGSSPGEDGFCSSVTEYDRRTYPRTKLLVFAGRLQEQSEAVGFSNNFFL
jgi:hypothetical protein